MSTSNPVRVSPQNKCPICGRDSWCMIGDAFILCMRSESDRPKLLKSGETGWLHPIGSNAKPVEKQQKDIAHDINFTRMIDTWFYETPTYKTRDLGISLGVSAKSMFTLRACYAWRWSAWAFPMRDGTNGIVGIRLRSADGKKWAVPGSHQGLFIPQEDHDKMMVICEGPTDTAAAITLGYFAVGRPSCSGGIDHIKLLVKRVQVRRALIVADLDAPGLRGAQTLAEHLELSTAILALPAKDMRAFVNSGGTREVMDSLVKQLVWRNTYANVDQRTTS